VTFGGETMGTTWSARVVAPPADLRARLEEVLTETIATFSQWEPTSALSRFNAGPLGSWQELRPALADVLGLAQAIAVASNGAFDPAAGALTDLWGFGPPGAIDAPPSAQEIAAARAISGLDGLELDGTRARRLRAVRLDLSGIAKGWAVDALAADCRAAGARDFLVEIGGEFVGAGIRPDGQPWWVELEDPPGVFLPPLRVAAHEVAVATSGDYRRFVYDGTRRVGHTLDPRTGAPVANGVVSVSVVATDCMRADAWATALTVLGPERAVATADRDGLAARIVTADGVERLTEAMQAMLA
jgi:FAD:protein FMN transferase